MAIARLPSPWRMALPLAFVLILFALWSGYWVWGAGRASEEVGAARHELARHGLDLACASERRGGYPFRFAFTCSGVSLKGADGSRAEAETLTVLAQAWDPGHLLFLLAGPVDVTGPDGTRWHLAHATAIASLVARRDEVRASLEVEALDAAGPLGERLTAARLTLHARLRGSDAAPPPVDFALSAREVALELDGREAGRIDEVSAEATLSLLPLPLASDVREFLRRAAGVGARLRIERGSAAAGAVSLEATGEVGLEPAGFPAGRIAVRLSDPRRFLANLAERGLMTAKSADAAAALLGLLTAGSTGAAGKPTAIDLVLEDGSVFWGPFRLARHGPLF